MVDYKKVYEVTKNLSVLLVEDFKPLRKEMSDILEDLFYKVTCASHGEEALSLYMSAYAFNKVYDIVISDIQMPKMNGVHLSKKIREIDAAQSIIILSAHTDSAYLLELLNIGISKFITKPIDYDDLFNTLREEGNCSQKLNRTNIEKSSVIHFGKGYTWDGDSYVLLKDKEEVVLTKYESLVLELLTSRKGMICSNEQILEHFQTYHIDFYEKNIRNLIFKLRKRLVADTIQSMYGLGYKLIS